MNSLVVHQHHQNIKMHSHNLMLKQILANAGVNFQPHILDVHGIASIINISTHSKFDITHPSTNENLHRHLLPKK